MQVIRFEDFRGPLAVGLSGAPEVRAAVETIAAGAESDFYARILGDAEADRFFTDLAAGEPAAVAVADRSRAAVTRYAYCRILQDSEDSLHALNGVFMTDSATGEAVAPNRRLTSTWNDMVLNLRRLRPSLDAYRLQLRRALGLPADCRAGTPFEITNTLMI